VTEYLSLHQETLLFLLKQKEQELFPKLSGISLSKKFLQNKKTAFDECGFFVYEKQAIIFLFLLIIISHYFE
jgi:hypothetical protein